MTIEQLKQEAVDMTYDKSASDSIHEHIHLMKESREKCLSSIRQTLKQLQQVVEEVERSTIHNYDQLEQDANKSFGNIGQVRFQPPDLNLRLPTGELNQNVIGTMREIMNRNLRGREVGNIKSEAIAAVK